MATYEEAAALGLANVEERAERNTWKPCQNCKQLWPTVSLRQLLAKRSNR